MIEREITHPLSDVILRALGTLNEDELEKTSLICQSIVENAFEYSGLERLAARPSDRKKFFIRFVKQADRLLALLPGQPEYDARVATKRTFLPSLTRSILADSLAAAAEEELSRQIAAGYRDPRTGVRAEIAAAAADGGMGASLEGHLIVLDLVHGVRMLRNAAETAAKRADEGRSVLGDWAQRLVLLELASLWEEVLGRRLTIGDGGGSGPPTPFLAFATQALNALAPSLGWENLTPRAVRYKMEERAEAETRFKK